MQSRGSSVRREEIKSFPSLLWGGQERQRQKQRNIGSLVVIVLPFPPIPVKAQIPGKEHSTCIKRKVENRWRFPGDRPVGPPVCQRMLLLLCSQAEGRT